MCRHGSLCLSPLQLSVSGFWLCFTSSTFHFRTLNILDECVILVCICRRRLSMASKISTDTNWVLLSNRSKTSSCPCLALPSSAGYTSDDYRLRSLRQAGPTACFYCLRGMCGDSGAHEFNASCFLFCELKCHKSLCRHRLASM